MKYFLCLIVLFIYSCNSSTSSNSITHKSNDTVTLNEDIRNDSVKLKNSEAAKNNDTSNFEMSMSCSDMLKRLIKTSSLDTAVKKMDFDLQIDRVNSGVITIELTIKNTERNDNVALSWIEMDLNKLELRDITVDPDNPVQLSYDKNLFEQIAKSCSW